MRIQQLRARARNRLDSRAQHKHANTSPTKHISGGCRIRERSRNDNKLLQLDDGGGGARKANGAPFVCVLGVQLQANNLAAI